MSESLLPHGTYNRYRKGCRCEWCQKANAAYSSLQRSLKIVEATLIESAFADEEAQRAEAKNAVLTPKELAAVERMKAQWAKDDEERDARARAKREAAVAASPVNV